MPDAGQARSAPARGSIIRDDGLLGTDRAALDRFRSSRRKPDRPLPELPQRLASPLPCALKGSERSRACRARLVVHVAAAMASADVEHGSGLLDPDPPGLAVRTQGRESRLPAIGAMELFHFFLPLMAAARPGQSIALVFWSNSVLLRNSLPLFPATSQRLGHSGPGVRDGGRTTPPENQACRFDSVVAARSLDYPERSRTGTGGAARDPTGDDGAGQCSGQGL